MFQILKTSPSSFTNFLVLYRFVIYIKEGEYFEYVTVNKNKTNLMFVGDGIGKTLIKGNRNYVDGWTTYWSATVGEFLKLNF